MDLLSEFVEDIEVIVVHERRAGSKITCQKLQHEVEKSVRKNSWV
jgi:hypothetical protein